MRIKALTTFLDDRDRFEKDDERTVDNARGRRFVANGWAKDLSGEIATGAQGAGEVSLDIHDVTHVVSAPGV